MDLAIGLNSARQVSHFDSFLGLVHFLLRDVDVAVVGPDGIGSQVAALAVGPVSFGDVGDSSALVVLGHFHSPAVLQIGLGLKFESESLVIFHLVKSPGRTDGQDIVALVRAFVFAVVVSHQADPVGILSTGAVAREGINGDEGGGGDDFGGVRRCVSRIIERGT